MSPGFPNYAALKGQFIQEVDVSHIDALFNWPDMVPVPAARLKSIPHADLQYWCWLRSIYQVPTRELIGFLRNKFDAPDEAIEIGSGAAGIGRSLRIRMTDNKMQSWPSIRAYYATLGNPTIQYPADVVTVGANEAVTRYQPSVVIGSWITDKWKQGDRSGNQHGPDELLFMKAPFLKKYIMVGNEGTHSDKKIVQEPPAGWTLTTYKADWLVSRAADQSLNRIYEFTRQTPVINLSR